MLFVKCDIYTVAKLEQQQNENFISPPPKI